MFILGLDLGQSQDYTALSILERLDGGGTVYNVRGLERTRGTSYPNIVKRVSEVMGKLPGSVLALDYTGVGRPVYDMFIQAGLNPVGILIHGGDRVNHEQGDSIYRVPKRDLIGVLKILFQNQQANRYPMMQIAKKLDLAETLKAEIHNLKVKIDPATAHDSYSAWREGDHDDLILSLGLAAWWGQQNPFVQLEAVTQTFGSTSFSSSFDNLMRRFDNYDDYCKNCE